MSDIYKGIEALEKLKMLLEEAPEMFKVTSKMWKIRYDSLIDAGFTEEQALKLCKEF